ncbi:alpha/beta hydrolase [Neptunitalea lumnitzerae]|uniref:Endo-1,4-beta-xylanase n=1 Tax=Neptunitalea lumnitzerae TaxID=2965509 RepID=A0ABQ5MM66_9FLAO|nr:alpha/beta hydrolase-fold protein [Neptunitalea sp. Y10]GLB50489.1 endo-1,4-beta-xylanase [Neptunitalea sp. Y10]
MLSKKSAITLLISILVSISFYAQNGTIISDSIFSKTLNKYKNFSVYLPPSYNLDSIELKRYPVIYLLHGLGGKPLDWDTHGDLNNQVTKAIIDSIIPETVIVLPDGEATYYMNNIHKEYEYEDFFFKEFLPFIEATYNCGGAKEQRGVAGLSMGGFGTLLYALHHPDMFVAGSALSPAVRTDEEMLALTDKGFAIRYKTAFGSPQTPKDRINPFYNNNSIIYLVKHLKEEDKGQVKLYIDIGDDDYLYKGNSTLHIVMKDLDIPHEYRVRNGGHAWEYWRTGLIDALSFITDNFKD